MTVAGEGAAFGREHAAEAVYSSVLVQGCLWAVTGEFS